MKKKDHHTNDQFALFSFFLLQDSYAIYSCSSHFIINNIQKRTDFNILHVQTCVRFFTWRYENISRKWRKARTDDSSEIDLSQILFINRLFGLLLFFRFLLSFLKFHCFAIFVMRIHSLLGFAWFMTAKIESIRVYA